MFGWTSTYLISQIFTILLYILLALTYFLKNRNTILVVGIISIICNAIAYVLLSAWTGFAMCIIALIRNVILIVDEKKNGIRECFDKKDYFILIFLLLLLIISSIPTYNGFLSLMSVFATALYTYSVIQKNTVMYKLLGIPTCLLWVIYNIFIYSIFGIILETVVLISSTIGFIIDKKKR